MASCSAEYFVLWEGSGRKAYGWGRAAAEQSRSWFAENDDMIGLSAAELGLANVALSAGDRVCARAHLEAAASVFGGIESTPQEGWVLAVLAAMSAEDDEPATARRWLDRAIRHFELLGGAAGMAYCHEVGRRPGVAAGERDGRVPDFGEP